MRFRRSGARSPKSPWCALAMSSLPSHTAVLQTRAEIRRSGKAIAGQVGCRLDHDVLEDGVGEGSRRGEEAEVLVRALEEPDIARIGALGGRIDGECELACAVTIHVGEDAALAQDGREVPRGDKARQAAGDVCATAREVARYRHASDEQVGGALGHAARGKRRCGSGQRGRRRRLR